MVSIRACSLHGGGQSGRQARHALGRMRVRKRCMRTIHVMCFEKALHAGNALCPRGSTDSCCAGARPRSGLGSLGEVGRGSRDAALGPPETSYVPCGWRIIKLRVGPCYTLAVLVVFTLGVWGLRWYRHGAPAGAWRAGRGRQAQQAPQAGPYKLP